MKNIENILNKTGLSRDYKTALGPVEHYIRRVKEYHQIKAQEIENEKDSLPSRWLHLAERTLIHRTIKKYCDYFSPPEYEQVIPNEQNSKYIVNLDEIIDEINIITSREGANKFLRDMKTQEFKKIEELYKKAINILHGIDK